MFESLPIRLGDAEAVDRFLNDLATATYPAIEALREDLIGRAVAGDHVAAHLLTLLTDEADTRPEGRTATRRRDLARLEGDAQFAARRRGDDWNVAEHTRATNQPTWAHPLDLPPNQAWQAFQGLARRPAYAANTGTHRLILQKRD